MSADDPVPRVAPRSSHAVPHTASAADGISPSAAIGAAAAAGLPAQAGSRGIAVERRQPADLAEILERVLNTGIVIAGEIRIDLLDIELLTIKLRLVITSLDRAEEVGLDWWRNDPWYSSEARQSGRRQVGPGARRDAIGSGDGSAADADDDRHSNDDSSNGSGQSEATDESAATDDDDAGESIYAEDVVRASASVARPASRQTRESADDDGVAKKSTAKNSSAKKKTAAKKSAAKKSAAKKSAAKKSASRKKSSGA